MSDPDHPISTGNAFTRHLPDGFKIPADDAGRLLLREYGAVFVARGGAVPPPKVVFEDEADVERFQAGLSIRAASIGAHRLELQSIAMDALESAATEARRRGSEINPRGPDSARRSYGETIGLWRSRVEPALEHWIRKGRISIEKAESIRALSPYEQVPEILSLEAKGIYFAKDLAKSIIYSVAPPGASQHLSMLAFDVAEFEQAEVRRILADNYWYQTVTSDLPHFTFLGVPENELSELGLRSVTNAGREFWVPDI